MARGQNQKLKLVYLMRIMLEETDEGHYITMPQIIELLEEMGVTAERKSLYQDIEELNGLGLVIDKFRVGRDYAYQVISRDFDFAELKLLVDAVQSSRLLTATQSNALIGKLEKLASRHEAGRLQRQVYVANRAKGDNDNVFYNVDVIHDAMNDNNQIKFKYFMWNAQKKKDYRKNGEFYRVSPWKLIWFEENYYLVAFDEDAGKVKHFRVDKITKIERDENSKRNGRLELKNEDNAIYSKRLFGMFDGEETSVTIECDNNLAGVMIDRFGKDVAMRPLDNGKFRLHTNVCVSKQFFGWLCGFGNEAKIVSPENVVGEMAAYVKSINELYQ